MVGLMFLSFFGHRGPTTFQFVPALLGVVKVALVKLTPSMNQIPKSPPLGLNFNWKRMSTLAQSSP